MNSFDDEGNGDDIAIAAKFLKRYGSHVKQITMTRNCGSFQDMVKAHLARVVGSERPPAKVAPYANFEMIVNVLKICNNVEVLSIKGFPPSGFKFEDPNPLSSLLSLPNLKHLTLTFTADSVFYLFMNCHLKSLVCSETDAYPGAACIINVYCFPILLSSQLNLEHLNFDVGFLLLEGSFLSDLSCKLKSLTLRCGTKFPENEEYYRKFLNAQKDTLQKLETCSCDWIHYFNGFPHIQYLKINFGTNFSNLLMESVTILTVMRYGNNQRILTPFAQSFPNLQEIKLEYFTIRFDILQNLPEVSKLSLIRCRLVHVSTFTKLKSLEIRECDIENQTFDWNENQLKELIIEKGHHDWIENFLNHKDTNLNYLRLIGPKYTMQLNPQLHEIINNNIDKIQCVSVDMYDPSEVTDEIHLELNDNGYETSDSESNDSDANVSGDDEN